MIQHQAFGHHEVIQILDTIISLICEIQSEVRKREYQHWYQEKMDIFRNSDEDNDLLLNKIILFLPQYFEMAISRIDELQLEVRSVYSELSVNVIGLQLLSLHARRLFDSKLA